MKEKIIAILNKHMFKYWDAEEAQSLSIIEDNQFDEVAEDIIKLLDTASIKRD